ncbi:MAG TPA: hypothetical protein VJH68_01465 [Candidatus Nanoarchaeia archaeon]|nr:hypothetical protein [Candidatus Nanoarchaeia archaeon]
MRVTIDTKEDSSEDIYKIWQILNNILNNKPAADAAAALPVDTPGLMTMFDDSASVKKEAPNTPPDFPSLMKLTQEAKNKGHNNHYKVELF